MQVKKVRPISPAAAVPMDAEKMAYDYRYETALRAAKHRADRLSAHSEIEDAPFDPAVVYFHLEDALSDQLEKIRGAPGVTLLDEHYSLPQRAAYSHLAPVPSSI